MTRFDDEKNCITSIIEEIQVALIVYRESCELEPIKPIAYPIAMALQALSLETRRVFTNREFH